MSVTSDMGLFHLTVLETSDIHGNIMPVQYANNQQAELGLAKISTIIRRERSVNGQLLFIDNGDLIQGTPLAYHHARFGQESANPLIACMNRIGCDAAVFGNHEFNYGMNVLQKAVNESRFPWLSANIVRKGTKEPYFGKPYVVKQFAGGPKVAVLGLTTHYIPNWENPKHIEALDFLDALESARTWVQKIRETEKPDVLIVSYHGGFERDPQTGAETEVQTGENQGYRLCREVQGIDVLLTGHQHRALAGLDINGVTIVQPGSQGTHLGKVTVTLEKRGEGWTIREKRSELVEVSGAEADEDIILLAAGDESRTQEWLDQPIGRVVGDMRIEDPMQVRMNDHPMIEFINRVQMDAAGVDISNTALFDNHAKGFGPEITMRDIVSNYIYPNTLKVIRVSGQDIKDALELCAAYFAVEGDRVTVSPSFSTPKPQHYNYDMWEGIDYEINVSRPVGERVVKLRYRGKPVDPAASFDVVMNNYRAGGGGNYGMFKGKPVVKDIPTDVSELMANYILERGTIEASVDHNWRVVRD